LQNRLEKIAAASKDSRGSIESVKEKNRPKLFPDRSKANNNTNDSVKFRRSKSVEARDVAIKDGTGWYETVDHS